MYLRFIRHILSKINCNLLNKKVWIINNVLYKQCTNADICGISRQVYNIFQTKALKIQNQERVYGDPAMSRNNQA